MSTGRTRGRPLHALLIVDAVYIHLECDGPQKSERPCRGASCPKRVRGELKLLAEENTTYISIIEWTPSTQSLDVVGDGVQQISPEESRSYIIRILVRDLISLRRFYAPTIDSMSISYITFVSRGGIGSPLFFFHQGHLRDFFSKLSTSLTLVRNKDDSDLFHVSHSSIISSTKAEPTLSEPQRWTWRNGFQAISKFTYDRFSLFAGNVRENKDNTNSQTQEPQKIVLRRKASTFTPPQVPEMPKTSPVTLEELNSYRNSEGRIEKESVLNLRIRVFYGGVTPSLRKQLWPYLLNYFSWKNTIDENETISKVRNERYKILKTQWVSIDDEQAEHCSDFLSRKLLIDRDVIRTDRNTDFFGENNDAQNNLKSLFEIILTYCQWNQNLGYMQGMNDIAAVFLETMENEVDAFWCFKGWMESLQENFTEEQTSMHAQMGILANILETLDAELFQYLKSIDTIHLMFCYRWLLLRFKRELSNYESVKRIWESLWTCPLTNHFHLFIAAALLIEKRHGILGARLPLESVIELYSNPTDDVSADKLLLAALKCYTVFIRIASVDSAAYQYIFAYDDRPW